MNFQYTILRRSRISCGKEREKNSLEYINILKKFFFLLLAGRQARSVRLRLRPSSFCSCHRFAPIVFDSRRKSFLLVRILSEWNSVDVPRGRFAEMSPRSDRVHQAPREMLIFAPGRSASRNFRRVPKFLTQHLTIRRTSPIDWFHEHLLAPPTSGSQYFDTFVYYICRYRIIVSFFNRKQMKKVFPF